MQIKHTSSHTYSDNEAPSFDWPTTGVLEFEGYDIWPLNSLDWLTYYFKCIDDMALLEPCHKETLEQGFRYFALIEKDSGIPWATVPVARTPTGYLPKYENIYVNAPQMPNDFWDLAEFLASTMSEREFGHLNDEAIQNAHAVAEIEFFRKMGVTE